MGRPGFSGPPFSWMRKETTGTASAIRVKNDLLDDITIRLHIPGDDQHRGRAGGGITATKLFGKGKYHIPAAVTHNTVPGKKGRGILRSQESTTFFRSGLPNRRASSRVPAMRSAHNRRSLASFSGITKTRHREERSGFPLRQIHRNPAEKLKEGSMKLHVPPTLA